MDLDSLLVGFNEQQDLIEADRELASRGYREFVPMAWDQVEPAQKFVGSWNVDAVCDHLDAVAKCQVNKLLIEVDSPEFINRLVINVPPNTSKSMSCSVMFAPWLWSQSPNMKLIYACFDDKLARRDSLRAKALIKSQWYQERWGDKVKINTSVRDTGDEYRTTDGGFRIITTIGGSITGEHANIQVVDDPIKPSETTGSKAVSKIDLDRVIDWWKDTMSTRLVDPGYSARVIIMQRLHEYDLAGYAIEQGYEHLMLPMEYEPERKCYTKIGFEDPRTEEGELLCPERFDRHAVDTLFEELGGRDSRGSQAQLQQDPVSLSGDIFKRGKENYYLKIPEFLDQQIQSWDCSFKKTSDGSFVSGQVWARKGADFYLLDQARGRWSFSETCEQVQYLTKKWPKTIAKLVEDKANGPAIISHFEREIPGMTPVEPYGDKVARAHEVEPYWTAGNVWLPHPRIAPWIEAFINEMTKFPNSKYNDQVDSATQALSYLGSSGLSLLQRAFG